MLCDIIKFLYDICQEQEESYDEHKTTFKYCGHKQHYQKYSESSPFEYEINFFPLSDYKEVLSSIRSLSKFRSCDIIIIFP
jgi:hypothetical protein